MDKESEGMGVSLCEARDPAEDYIPQENPEGTPVTKAIRRGPCVTKFGDVVSSAGWDDSERRAQSQLISIMGRVWP